MQIPKQSTFTSLFLLLSLGTTGIFALPVSEGSNANNTGAANETMTTDQFLEALENLISTFAASRVGTNKVDGINSNAMNATSVENASTLSSTPPGNTVEPSSNTTTTVAQAEKNATNATATPTPPIEGLQHVSNDNEEDAASSDSDETAAEEDAMNGGQKEEDDSVEADDAAGEEKDGEVDQEVTEEQQ